MTFPDLVWTVDQIVPVVAQGMAFYRLADGKIVEERAQLDMLSVLQQIGALPGAE